MEHGESPVRFQGLIYNYLLPDKQQWLATQFGQNTHNQSPLKGRNKAIGDLYPLDYANGSMT